MDLRYATHLCPNRGALAEARARVCLYMCVGSRELVERDYSRALRSRTVDAQSRWSHGPNLLHRATGGGGGDFGGGGDSVLQICAEFFCAIRATSCSLGRQLSLLFCREVLVPVYCMSGSVFVPVRIPILPPLLYPVYLKE